MTAEPMQRPGRELDPRRNAFRANLAAKALEGLVKADRYVEGEIATVIRSSVPLRKLPEPGRSFETEVLFGETVTVYDQAAGWAWVQLGRDGYVGYLPAEALRRGFMQATHRIQALGTFLYGAPDIKTPPVMHLAMNALVVARNAGESFIEIENGFIYGRHATFFDRFARDYVEIAERFVGVPYLWGGRTRIGIDCSGLVQTALQAAGLPAPRDSDMQHADLGDTITINPDYEGLQRGDLVFWKGHVGIMLDSVMMIHANAYHMVVAVEPLPEAALRIAKTGGEITGIKRLSALGASSRSAESRSPLVGIADRL